MHLIAICSQTEPKGTIACMLHVDNTVTLCLFVYILQLLTRQLPQLMSSSQFTLATQRTGKNC